MALNFSHRPIFPSHLSEDKLVSPIRIANGYLVDGIPERSGDGFVRPRHSSREVEDCFDFGGDRADRSGSPESVSKDILDLLPSDPFGMDISTTFTAITGWLEDLEVDYGGSGRNLVATGTEDYNLFAGLNLIWNNAVRFQSFPSNVHFSDKVSVASPSDGWTKEKEIGNAFCRDGFGLVPNVDIAFSFEKESTGTSAKHVKESQVVVESCSDGDGGAPHEALLFALSFLGVWDLLSVERVCRSLRSTVQNDPLLWRSIHIDQPVNEKITDDVLCQLTSRAQGNLQCLSLVECPRITDDGLKHVLETNLRLTKLCVPGCTRLSIEGIVSALKVFKSKGTLGITHLRIGGLYGITDELFEELKLLLGAGSLMQQNDRKPHFYHGGNHYLLCDDDRVIDVEECPKCQKLRLVYDCPAEGCQQKENGPEVCRACRLCIPRCVQCGRCINDSEYEETFCLEWLCADCSKQLLTSPERQDGNIGPLENVLVQESSNGIFLHG